jgi:Lrp/AsnC family transcriptional regulator, leucine-responsive regulatory protein
MPNLARQDGLVASNAMDALDREILRHLQEDGRLANTELAERIRLSPTPCLRRVRRLEQSGVITGYRAIVDPASVDRGFQVLVHVTMEVKDRENLMEAFEAKVAELDEVIECRRMFGDPDYLLWVAAANLEAYEQLYMTKLVGLPGVARTVSQLTMKTVKPGGRLPL